MSDLGFLLEGNREWAEAAAAEDPTLFERLERGQEPKVLWIGCADSRVPASLVLNQPPGELFVHRNVANLCVATDLNFLSALQFALQFPTLKDIIVCGHTQCQGVRFALDSLDEEESEDWLVPLRNLATSRREELLTKGSVEQQWEQLVVWNIVEQVENVANTSAVQAAWQDERELTIHGWLYKVASGRIKDLSISRDGRS